ncbi:MAG: amidohydrolase family protein [Coriobacteriales bacterium]|jgi:predicted TIM-barrel fold metal-dependent hydrolase|nr:amidohydrolase family protein [Coriobacteriales bacterium]
MQKGQRAGHTRQAQENGSQQPASVMQKTQATQSPGDEPSRLWQPASPLPPVVVDIHNHIYPEKIAAKAVESVGRFYGIEMSADGSARNLLSIQQQAHISYSLVCSVALKPDQVQTINDFIAAECQRHPSFIGFATMHHDFPNKAAEIQRVCDLGLTGFKLHPDSQGVNVDDPRLLEFYALIEDKLPLMLHCGDYRFDNSHPHRTQRVLRQFPLLKVNCAHFGGWSLYDLAVEFLEHERCFLDISSASVYLGPRRTTELIHHYGAERILFGSDFPMWHPGTELERFYQNVLTPAEREQILWHSAEAYLDRDLKPLF